MQEQNFEKEVRHKMNELILTPAPPVWEKVEARIRKKKERKRVLFWMFPLLLLTGGTSLWFFAGNKPTQINISKNTGTKTLSPSGPKTDPSSTTSKVQRNVLAPTTSVPGEINKKPHSLSKTLHKERTSKTRTIAINEINNPPLSTKNPSPSTQVNKDNTSEKEMASTDHPDKEPVFTPSQLPDSLSKRKEENMDAPLAPTSLAGKIQDTAKNMDNPVTKEINKQNEKKWQWSVNASAGISTVQKQGISGSRRAAFSSPQSGAVAQNLPSSSLKNGSHYQAGFTGQRKWNNRSSLTLGLQYSRFTTQLSVGNMVRNDTVLNTAANQLVTVDAYYRTGQSRNYINRYGFIEIPVGYSYQLFKKEPLHFHGGFSLVQLLYSNRLSYHSGANVYFSDQSQLNKTQLHFFSHISYSIWQQKNFMLQAGPYFQYGLTPVSKESAMDKQHLLSTGLRTSFVLKKGKN
jgi:hypothetical protein